MKRWYVAILLVFGSLWIGSIAVRPRATVSLVTDPDLVGYDVRDMNGVWIGEVQSLVVDLANGAIQYVVLELPPYPRSYSDAIAPRLLPIPWPELEQDAAARILKVGLDQTELREAPRLQRVAGAPASGWGDQVAEFWNSH